MLHANAEEKMRVFSFGPFLRSIRVVVASHPDSGMPDQHSFVAR